MEGKYPVMIDGAPVGTLTVGKKGAMTVFEARCRMMEGIVRLSVYGRDSEGYLGVLAPEEGELRLRRSLSPAALRAFPGEIVEAGPAGRGRAAMTVLPDREEEAAETAARPKPAPVSSGEEAPPEAERPPAEAESPAETAEDGGDTDGLYWYASPDGALVCFDGERSLIALPPGDERIPANIPGKRRMVEGREYLVFVTRNSRILW